MTAEEIIQWIEDKNGLHTTVDTLYVVDGYEVCLMRNDYPYAGPYKADTLIEAFRLAAKENP